jgi:cytochrome P450
LRKAVQDVTLIDGSVIPKGTYVCPATQAMHTDEEFYESATTFNPFRFAEMRTGDENDAVRYQFPSTGVDYMSFGHGRNAW